VGSARAESVGIGESWKVGRKLIRRVTSIPTGRRTRLLRRGSCIIQRGIGSVVDEGYVSEAEILVGLPEESIATRISKEV
jgi:hypothetical protein